MSIIQPRGIPPLHSQEISLKKLLETSKKFIAASDCTRVSMLVTFVHEGKEYNEVLVFENKIGIPVPKQELYIFFHQLAENIIAKTNPAYNGSGQ